MQLTESSIFIGLKRLRQQLYTCQFLMSKGDRIVYGTPLMQECGLTIANFVVAFTVGADKLKKLEEAIGWYAVLRMDIEYCVSENIIHFAKPKMPKDPRTLMMKEGDYVSHRKIELFKLVAQIDDDMCKWKTSLAKGKTVADKR